MNKLFSTVLRKIQQLSGSRPAIFVTDSKLGQVINFNGVEFIPLTDLKIRDSAILSIDNEQKRFLLGVLLFLIFSFLVNWYVSLVILISIITILYFTDLLFNLSLIARSFHKVPEIKVSRSEIRKISEDQWPTYTILCPLYKEWQVLPQFVEAISRFDYPKDKLQVLLLLEADDKQTVLEAEKMKLPSYFEIVVVPDTQPKTKPKACNYGLSMASGEYLVIYDAEDIPDPDQLKKAVLAFRKVDKNVTCIQAKLNFYNPYQNIQTRLFTAEYSLWFDLVLTGLQSINAPIPLGGTSNHFPIKYLRTLQGWDPFNVTEDADLGMRLQKRGFKTALLDSTTWEEANSSLSNWFKQRSRWIKGYIQSYIVHMRRQPKGVKGWNKVDFVTFQLVIGGKILSMLINPLMWVITLTYFIFRDSMGPFIESLYLTPIFYMGVFCLVFGNFLYMYYYMIGVAKREQWSILPFTLLTPFYWLMMSAAAFYAVYDFIKRPFYWYKTQHGLHLQKSKGLNYYASLIFKVVPTIYRKVAGING